MPTAAYDPGLLCEQETSLVIGKNWFLDQEIPARDFVRIQEGSPILLPLVLLVSPRKVDLLVPPTERKEGQTSLRLLQFSWHY